MTLALVEHCVTYGSSKGVRIAPDTHPQDYVLLEDAAEEAKLALSTMEKTTIVWRADTQLFDLEVSRAEFERLIAPITEAVRGLIQETLAGAKMKREDVDIVVPAGGGSRVPAIRKLLEEVFGPDKVMKNIDPDRAVILGALEAIPLKVKEAVDSGQTDIKDILPDYIIEGKISLTEALGEALGARAVRRENGMTVLATIVEANTPLPCSMERRFGLRQDQGKAVTADIVVLQGDPDAPVEAATTLEVFPLKDLPPGPDTQRIGVRFEIDANGLVNVHACDTVSGKEIRGTVKAHRTRENEPLVR
jgi:molecular chaperone DnaK